MQDLGLRDHLKNFHESMFPTGRLDSCASIMSSIGGKAVLDSDSVTDSEEDKNSRDSWGNNFEFLLSCLLYVVGFGNLVRFPSLCYENGGGAFLVPYLISLILVGIPIFYLELAIGQYSSVGPISIWSLSPAFKGIGYGVVLSSFFVSLTYNVLVSWSIYYFFASMQTTLPWSFCNPNWASEACVDKNNDSLLASPYNISNITDIYSYRNISTSSMLSTTLPDLNINNQENTTLYNMTLNNTEEIAATEILKIMSSEEYFYREFLKMSDSGFSSFGYPQWRLMLSLFAAWFLVFLCLLRGVRSAGKTAIVFAPLPYIILTALLIENSVRDPVGVAQGIKYYITPKWHLLTKAKVWYDAVVQVFFSLSIMQGGLITLSSYNKFHHNVYRSALLIAVCDTLTSIFAGFVVFAILGVISNEAGIDISVALKGSRGTAFVTITEALSRMPLPQLWSVLYFLMLITLGLGTSNVLVETIITALIDEFPLKLAKCRIKLTAGFTAGLFILGLPLTCNGGVYLMAVIDKFNSSYGTMLLAFLFVMSISWVYKVKRLRRNIKSMLGVSVSHYWTLMWSGITPFLLLGMFAISFYGYSLLTEKTYFTDYIFPVWTEVVGWFLLLVQIIPLPVLAVLAYRSTEPSLPLKQRLKRMLSASLFWGPALEVRRLHLASMGGGRIPKPTCGSVKTSNDIGGLDSIFSATVGNNVIVKMAQAHHQTNKPRNTYKLPHDVNTTFDPEELKYSKIHGTPIIFEEEGKTYMLVPKKKSLTAKINQSTQTVSHFYPN